MRWHRTAPRPDRFRRAFRCPTRDIECALLPTNVAYRSLASKSKACISFSCLVHVIYYRKRPHPAARSHADDAAFLVAAYCASEQTRVFITQAVSICDVQWYVSFLSAVETSYEIVTGAMADTGVNVLHLMQVTGTAAFPGLRISLHGGRKANKHDLALQLALECMLRCVVLTWLITPWLLRRQSHKLLCCRAMVLKERL